jgi:glycosyltransferase involved in cell wall biosynthesis
MNNIIICIPTYKRPEMLKKLIQSIANCNLNRTLIKNINIIVVDNDVDKTAELVIKELSNIFNHTFKIYYSSFSAKGISNVRNELIKKASFFNPDFIVFIDDDEFVTSEWLNELVKTIISNNSDAARGPVIAMFEKSVTQSISCCFKRESYSNNISINSLTTGNLILKFKSLKEYDVWFDSRFNVIGSGDSYFGNQILKKGAKIVWAENAITYETIPEKRASLGWLIKRVYRHSSTYTYMTKLEKEYLKLLKKIVISLIYITIGGTTLISILFPIKNKYWGILTFTEGIGGLAGLVNVLYKEYK